MLANGSVQKKEGETSSQARRRDENEAARARLLAESVDVKVDREHRFISPGALGHNKFLVRTDKEGKPVTVWTCSTNWAPTGLCTQVNNGLLIEDPQVAEAYLQQWHALHTAGSLFPDPLVAANSQPKLVGEDIAGKIRSIVWFSRTKNRVDLEAMRAEIEKAKEGILFLMFMPGSKGLYADVLARSKDPKLYVRGVVSELPEGPGNERTVDVNLVDGKTRIPMRLNIIQPEGVRNPMAYFAAKVTHKQFLAGVGHAIIRSKVLVIDPFSPDPVVITGSHNFSSNASTSNDENFIIVKGDHALAHGFLKIQKGVW